MIYTVYGYFPEGQKWFKIFDVDSRHKEPYAVVTINGKKEIELVDSPIKIGKRRVLHKIRFKEKWLPKYLGKIEFQRSHNRILFTNEYGKNTHLGIFNWYANKLSKTKEFMSEKECVFDYYSEVVFHQKDNLNNKVLFEINPILPALEDENKNLHVYHFQAPFTIGRQSAILKIDHPDVSKKHGWIQYHPGHKCYIYFDISSNGSIIERLGKKRRIHKSDDKFLDGDHLIIGNKRYRFVRVIQK